MKKISHENFLKTSITTLCITTIMVAPAMAGTDGAELSTAYDKFSGIVGGIGGKIVALFSGAIGLIGCAVKFNPAAILSFFGVAIGVGSLSFIVDSTITCMLYF